MNVCARKYQLSRTGNCLRYPNLSMFYHRYYTLFIYKNSKLQCDPDIREILSDPKLKPVLPKQNRPSPDIRDLFSAPNNSLISGLHCTYFWLKSYNAVQEGAQN